LLGRADAVIEQASLVTVHESLIDAVDGSSTGTRVPRMWALLRLPRFRGATHADDPTIGLDIAKSVFQVHGVNAAREVVIRRQLKRRYVLAFFEKLSAWRLAPRLTTGRANFRRLAIPCD
jgi:hypothetical protein